MNNFEEFGLGQESQRSPDASPYFLADDDVDSNIYDEPPADIKSTEEALRWFAFDFYAYDYRPAMAKVLGPNQDHARIRSEIARVLDEWSVSPRDDDFIAASNLVMRISETNKDISKNFSIKLLKKQNFLSQEGRASLEHPKGDESFEEKKKRIHALSKANIAATEVASRKNNLIGMFGDDLEHWFSENERDSAVTAIQSALGEIQTRYDKLIDDDRALLWRNSLLFGTEKQKSVARQRLSDDSSGDEEYKLMASEIYTLLLDKNPIIRDEAIGIISSHLHTNLGIDSALLSTFVDSWDKSSDQANVAYAIRDNLYRIENLECMRPGIIRELSDRFGIHDFARYPAAALVWQYDHAKEAGFNYGLVVYPRDDWNGAFYNESTLDNLFGQMQSGDEEWGGLLIVEADTKLSAVRQMNIIRRVYGSASFGIIGGHGTADSIQFGNNFDRGGVLRIDDVEKMIAISDNFSEKTEKSNDSPPALFKSGSTIMLISCSTGSAGGIGSKISKLTQGIIIAPSVPTGVKSMKFIAPEDENAVPTFEVTYGEENAGVKFQNGQPIE